jgi:hypothetical protein
MACRSGCLTKDHASYGDCLRAANFRIAYCGVGGGDATTQKNWDKGIEAYRSAKAQGIQPAGTKLSQIRAAVEKSDRTGKAFVAS